MVTDRGTQTLDGVADAESWVRRQIVRYRQANAAIGDQLLLDAVATLDASLPALCRDLAERAAYRDFAYRHNLGFFVLFLTDPDIGMQCRLHIWLPSAAPVIEKPHRHRMGFASKILAGELRAQRFTREALPAGGAAPDLRPGDGVFHETCINAPAHGDYTVASTELVRREDVVLRLVSDHRYRTGETYAFPATDIHRVCTPADLMRPNVTLTVWEPPFQDSIAYEPLGCLDGSLAIRRPVTRVSDGEYRGLLATVRAALGAQELSQ